MGVQQLLNLANEDGGLHGLDEHLVGADVGPIVVGEGSEQGDCGVIGSGAGGLDDLAAGGVALHAHVGDDHLVLAQFNFGASLACAGGRIHIKSADLEDGFQSQQNSYFIVDKQNAALSQGSLLIPARPARV